MAIRPPSSGRCRATKCAQPDTTRRTPQDMKRKGQGPWNPNCKIISCSQHGQASPVFRSCTPSKRNGRFLLYVTGHTAVWQPQPKTKQKKMKVKLNSTKKMPTTSRGRFYKIPSLTQGHALPRCVGRPSPDDSHLLPPRRINWGRVLEGGDNHVKGGPTLRVMIPTPLNQARQVCGSRVGYRWPILLHNHSAIYVPVVDNAVPWNLSGGFEVVVRVGARVVMVLTTKKSLFRRTIVDGCCCCDGALAVAAVLPRNVVIRRKLSHVFQSKRKTKHILQNRQLLFFYKHNVFFFLLYFYS